MTVKQLRDRLELTDDDAEVQIRIDPDRWADYEPEIEFGIVSVAVTLERDTGERIVVIECDQQPE